MEAPQSLVDVIDSLLDTGVVADAQLVVSVAGVDLIHVGLRALLASVDTAMRVVPCRRDAPDLGQPGHGGDWMVASS